MCHIANISESICLQIYICVWKCGTKCVSQCPHFKKNCLRRAGGFCSGSLFACAPSCGWRHMRHIFKGPTWGPFFKGLHKVRTWRMYKMCMCHAHMWCMCAMHVCNVCVQGTYMRHISFPETRYPTSDAYLVIEKKPYIFYSYFDWVLYGRINSIFKWQSI